MATELLSSLAKVLPRLYELKDLTDQSCADAYFRDFERRFSDGKTVLAAYQKIEQQLAALDDRAWSDLKSRAARTADQRIAGRGWQPLFDTLNEAKGYVYLQGIGCTGIAFIPRTNKKTPDLGAFLGATRVLCEVKSINITENEADRRKQVEQGQFVIHSTAVRLTEAALRRVRRKLEDGIEQLESDDPQRAARRIVFAVVDFDDWVGDCQPQYFAQLDAHLLAKTVVGAELVFCPARNLFKRCFAMQSACVVEL